MASSPNESVVGVVLAGGASARLEGEKPFRMLGGRMLIEHVTDRVEPQVGALWISARHNAAALSRLARPIVEDRRGDGPGSVLDAIVAIVDAAATAGFAFAVTVPCDAPFLPRDLVARLVTSLEASDVPGVTVQTGERMHPTIAAWRPTALPALAAARDKGALQLHRLCRELGVVVLDAARCGWAADAFFNVNTPADLEAAARRLR